MTDDRGIYRIYSLQPGEYVLSAIPRNLNPATDMRQLIMSQATALQESLGQMPARRTRRVRAWQSRRHCRFAGRAAGHRSARAAARHSGGIAGGRVRARSTTPEPRHRQARRQSRSQPRKSAVVSISSCSLFQRRESRARSCRRTARCRRTSSCRCWPRGLAAHRSSLSQARRSRAWTAAASSRSVTSRPASTRLQARAIVRRTDSADAARGGGAGRGGPGPVPPNQSRRSCGRRPTWR